MITICSSNGELAVDSNGYVNKDESVYENDELKKIVWVDLEEHTMFWGHEPADHSDILDFGLWDDGNYVEPEMGWRFWSCIECMLESLDAAEIEALGGSATPNELVMALKRALQR